MEEPRLGGQSLSPVGTEKLVRTLLLLAEEGAAGTSPRLGAGVVIILSDYLVLYSHYNQQHLVLTLGPKPKTAMFPTTGQPRAPARIAPRAPRPPHTAVCVLMIPQLSQDILRYLRNTAISVTTDQPLAHPRA